MFVGSCVLSWLTEAWSSAYNETSSFIQLDLIQMGWFKCLIMITNFNLSSFYILIAYIGDIK